MAPLYLTAKYARTEWERRFLLGQLPAGLDPTRFEQIEDIYWPATRLRLRKIMTPTGEILALKLTQKYQASHQSDLATTITNTYLSLVEYQLLAQIPGRVLQKHRYHYPFNGHTYSIDQFQGHLHGLITAEIEATDEQTLLTLPLPPFALADITSNSAYRGSNLAYGPSPLTRSQTALAI